MRRIPKHRPPSAHLSGPRRVAPGAEAGIRSPLDPCAQPLDPPLPALLTATWRTWPGHLGSRDQFLGSRRRASQMRRQRSPVPGGNIGLDSCSAVSSPVSGATAKCSISGRCYAALGPVRREATKPR